jgi:smad nuclear-interacting protein 1
VGYYGPSQHRRAVKVDNEDDQVGRENDRDKPGRDAADSDPDPANKVKPDFGLSGALSKDVKTGNVYKGVLLKFREPPEARAPNTLWRLYVYKGDDLVETLHVNRQSAYLFGRHADVCDVVLHHASCSTQHAVLQYRAVLHPATQLLHCQPYLMDLESTNGTFLNGVRLDSARYYQLKAGDVLRFGASTREYVFLSASSNKATTKK